MSATSAKTHRASLRMALIGLALCLSLVPAVGQVTGTSSSVIAHLKAPKIDVRVGLGTGASDRRWIPEGTNRVAPEGTSLKLGDVILTGPGGSATIDYGNGITGKVGPNTQVLLQAPTRPGASLGLRLMKGLLQILHRPENGELELDCGPDQNAGFRGTEIVAEMENNGTARFYVLDGELSLAGKSPNRQETIVKRDEVAEAAPGESPRVTTLDAATARRLTQWTLRYPTVLVPEDISLNPAERNALAEALAEYGTGNVPGAFMAWPAEPVIGLDARIVHSALQLGTGSRTQATAWASAPEAGHPSAVALRVLLAAVDGETLNPVPPISCASIGLALSYYYQAHGNPRLALAAVRDAAKLSTSGYVLARQAELEFGFGGSAKAPEVLARAIESTPNLASAHSLRGFMALAGLRPTDAATNFEAAVRLDPGLGEAWLGLGLARIDMNQPEAGRAAILNATTVEPQHWLLRSYLAKAYSHSAEPETKIAGWWKELFSSFADPNGRMSESDAKRAGRLRDLALHELEYAKRKDTNDPTAWLYAALELDQAGFSSAAITNLDGSIARNSNRAVYRSRFFLDDDWDVRKANVADIYSRAGMMELSLREAAKAVVADQTDYAAHAHLAGTLDALRDPTRFNLRHETEWFNEHLLATLLSPVSAGSLSQYLSRNDYPKLFDRNGLQFASTTEFLSRGEWREVAAQSGTLDNFGYALDLDSQFRAGDHGARDLSRIEWYARAKAVLTRKDTLLLLTKYMDYDTGDFFTRFDPGQRNPEYRLREKQDPLFLAGWRHEWSPAQQTLLLAGRLEDRQHVEAPGGQVLLVPLGNPIHWEPVDLDYHNSFQAGSFEAEHLSRYGSHSDIIGLRWQQGDFQARNSLIDTGFPFLYGTNFSSAIDASFDRVSAYLYHTWEALDDLFLTGGLAYDDLTGPANYRRPPVSAGEESRSQVSPKTSLVWTPKSWFSLRGMWARSLGGVSLDESIRLEPTQLAGFSQSFRSLASESVVGSVELPAYESAGLGLDFKLGTRTWLGLSGERIDTEVNRVTGYLENDNTRPPGQHTLPLGTRESINYVEHRVAATLDHNLAEEWFAQLQYRFTGSTLDTGYPALVGAAGTPLGMREWADFHEVRAGLTYRARSGWFARAEAGLFYQRGVRAPAPDGVLGAPEGHSDELVQLNAYVGREFFHRRAEVTVGILNLSDSDYRFSPLTSMTELPRSRLFYTRLRLNF